MLDVNALQRMIYLMMHTFISVGMQRNNTANTGAMNNRHITCNTVYTTGGNVLQKCYSMNRLSRK
jgi:hypothetical protein